MYKHCRYVINVLQFADVPPSSSPIRSLNAAPKPRVILQSFTNRVANVNGRLIGVKPSLVWLLPRFHLDKNIEVAITARVAAHNCQNNRIRFRCTASMIRSRIIKINASSITLFSPSFSAFTPHPTSLPDVCVQTLFIFLIRRESYIGRICRNLPISGG
jgi:hypothetical protein